MNDRDDAAPLEANFDLSVENSSDETTVIMTLVGRLDSINAVALRQKASTMTFTAGGLLHVDLRGLVFLDSAGLAALVQIHRLCGHAGTKIEFSAPRSPEAWRVFTLTKFDEIFAFVTTSPRAAPKGTS